jgi:phosphoglycerate dehydrogenase-like enzyme
MIRILVVDRLDPRALDLLNEIPEFEISEKTGLYPAQLLEEIKNADALVIDGSVPLTAEFLKSSRDLKLIVRSGHVSGPVDEAAARRQNIEIRTAVGHCSPQAAEKMKDEIGVDVIVILKDFFSV